MANFEVVNYRKAPIPVSGLKMVTPPEMSFKIEVNLDKKIEKAASKDPLLQQEFKNQAQDIYEQTKKTIAQKCKVFDKLFVDMINKGADQKAVQKQLDGLNKAIDQDIAVAKAAAKAGVEKTWKELQAKKKEWKGFKIKIVASIVGTVAGLAASIAAMATSPFSGGAGAVLGIAGLVKSGATLAKDITKIAVDIEGARKILSGQLTYLEGAAKKGGVFTANEVGAAVLEEFIGIAQPSIKSMQDASDTLKAKYAQMVVKVHDLSKTLDKILKEQKKVKKEFLTEAAKKVKKHPTTDKAGQLKKVEANLDKVLKENYDKVDAQIGKVTKLYADTRKWADTIKELMKRVAKIELKDSKGLKVLREVLKVVGVATSVIEGNAIATEAKDLALGLGSAAGGYVYDKIASKALDGTIWDAA